MNTARIGVWAAALLGAILAANAPAQSSTEAGIQAAISSHAADPWSTERDGAEADDSQPMSVFRHELTTLLRANSSAYQAHLSINLWKLCIG
jgi:hypothetical protein